MKFFIESCVCLNLYVCEVEGKCGQRFQFLNFQPIRRDKEPLRLLLLGYFKVDKKEAFSESKPTLENEDNDNNNSNAYNSNISDNKKVPSGPIKQMERTK